MPTLLAQASPEADGVLSAHLPAALEQGHRLLGEVLPAGDLQGLPPPVPAGRAKMQHLSSIADPALPRRERWPLAAGTHGLG
jgi:hypothetical protein